MAAGGPGDHPLTDILNFRLPVYGTEADDIIRQLDQLMGRQRLGTWFEENRLWSMPPNDVLKKVSVTRDQELKRAKAAGWEVPAP